MGLKIIVLGSAGGDSITPSQADAQELANDAVAPWKTFITGDGSLASRFSQWVDLTEIRCTVISATNIKVPGTDTQVAVVPQPASGGAGIGTASGSPGSGEVPYQVALCATLTGSLFTSGPASHGRFYVPCPVLGYNAANTTYQHMVNGQMTPAATTDWANALKTLLAAFSSITLASGHVAQIANISTSADAGPVRWQPVAFVSVDNRPDTIRRRSNSIGGQGRVRVPLVV